MMKRKFFLLVFLPVLIAAFGCAREWKNPDTALAVKELKIESILINPIIYDSAGVAVEGKVWDLKFEELQQKTELPYTSFKLADEDGHYVNVFASGHLPIAEGEIVEVTGIYRRQFPTEVHNFVNEIEAERVERRN